MLSALQREVILALAAGDMNITKASKLIYKHRNTMVFHIRAIRKATGKDPLKFYDLVELVEMVKGE